MIIIMLMERKKKTIINFMRIEWVFILTNLISFTQGCFAPNLVQIGPVVLEKKMKMWKVYENDDDSDNNDDNGQRRNSYQKISLKPSAQVS